MKNLLLLLLAFSLTSCVSFREKRKAKICATCPDVKERDTLNTTTEKITIKDTTIFVPADSSWYRAWIECKDGKPIIHKSKQKDGKRSKIDVNLSKEGELKVVANCDSLNFVVQYYQKEIERLTKINATDTIKEPCKKKPLQDMFYSIGAITSGIILLLFTFAFIRLAQGKPIHPFNNNTASNQREQPPS